VNKEIVARCVLLLVFWGGVVSAAPQPGASANESRAAKERETDVKSPELDYIAIVNGQKISMGEYVSALRRGIRERFYHGKIEENEAKKIRKEIADELVERALLIQEARRRKLTPDMDEVEANIEAFDARFQADPEWETAREKVLPKIREKLSDDSLVKVLKAVVKTVKVPTKGELEKYYSEHTDLFTTPARDRVSLILLKVDPVSSSDVWEQANDEARSIIERINAGTDFAELARIHSSDKSAENGGDMGFIHQGMLGGNAQKVLDIMEPGEVSAPVVLLEGVAIFQLDERTRPELNSFEVVKDRAQKLYQREMADEAWKVLLLELHAKAVVTINNAPWR